MVPVAYDPKASQNKLIHKHKTWEWFQKFLTLWNGCREYTCILLKGFGIDRILFKLSTAKVPTLWQCRSVECPMAISKMTLLRNDFLFSQCELLILSRSINWEIELYSQVCFTWKISYNITLFTVYFLTLHVYIYTYLHYFSMHCPHVCLTKLA